MKAWKKGAIIGSIWGLISEVPFLITGFGGHGGTPNIYLKWKVLAFPAYLGDLITRKIGDIVGVELTLVGVIIILLFPIFIGALIGSVIVMVYPKVIK